MNIEATVLSKIVSTGKIEDAFSKGIRAEHFVDEKCREMYEHISEHARRYKSAPSSEALKEQKPEWEQVFVQDSLEYLLDRFIVVVKRREAGNLVLELAKMVDDPEHGDDIDLQFLEASRKLATIVPSTKVARFKDMDQRVADYKHQQETGEKPGLGFGFSSLDAWTGGIQAHEFVVVSGFSGLGKSTMLLALTRNFWEQGKTPLYVSLEMESSMILRKLDAMAAGLDYMKMKQMNLAENAISSWERQAKEVRKKLHDIPIIDSIRGCTPDHIFAETVRHKPDVVIVDYLSLMRSARPNRTSSMWQGLTEITQDLKQNARTLHTPIVAAAQTNRAGDKDGAELGNMGYSISIVQDSDIVIGLFSDASLKERKRMEIRLNKNRDGRLGTLEALWDHEAMVFREIEHEDKFGKPGPKS